MKILGWTAASRPILAGWAGSVAADPWRDESDKDRWRGGYERRYDGLGRGRAYGDERPRRERRAFKPADDDGRCRYERTLGKRGEYKEESGAVAASGTEACGACDHPSSDDGRHPVA